MSSFWADRHGVHSVPLDRNSIDCLCIYCPDTHACYYVDPRATAVKTICLRIDATRNNVKKRVVWAKDFTEIPATVLGVSAGPGTPLERTPLVRHSSEPRAVYRLHGPLAQLD